MNYQQAVEYIHSIGRFGSKPGLERVQALLELLGNPQEQLRFVHVAGTNGKGSTSVMLANMLRANDLRVGLFTSPYLESFTNRIAQNGKDIAEQDVAHWVSKIVPLCEQIAADESLGQPTQFEIITAMAMGYYAEQEVDIVVLEVGLGGRLDATNVITPDVAVITTIGYDHQAILGDTLAEIASEKAGIIKEGVPVVTGVREDEALQAINDKANKMGSQLYVLGRDFNYSNRQYSLAGQSFDYEGLLNSWSSCKIGLLGEHQVQNASVALATVECLRQKGFMVLPDQMRAGLADARWPGRLEVVGKEPLVLLDGAHNTHGTAALRTALSELFGDKKLIVVLGILSDKDYPEMMADILPLAKNVIVTAPDYYRATDTDALLSEAKKYVTDAIALTPVSKAIDKAKDMAAVDDVIIITGSLYTIGEARTHLVK